jgi:hypothetical protein
MARNPRLANQALQQELLSRPRSYRGRERRKRSSALPRRQLHAFLLTSLFRRFFMGPSLIQRDALLAELTEARVA